MSISNKNRFLWLNGKIVRLSDAKVNVLSPTSQFGANVFEGIRCYWNEDDQQLYAFRLDDHYKRLKNSMKIFRIDDIFTSKMLKDALIETIKANNYKEDIAIRQTVFIDGFGSWYARNPVGMFIAPIPKRRSSEDVVFGYSSCISSWQRISDKNLSPKVKVGANYINSRMAQLEALENGYDTSIFLNDSGKISEAPGSCIFIVRDGELITPPITASILESITRDSIIRLAKSELNLVVIERDIDRTELYICDEIFLCGSSIEVVPIFSVDRINVNDGKQGEITRKLKKIYLDVVVGKLGKYREWLTIVN